ncbi:MAG: NAD(P)-dependent alcohol dehydrogenase [Burkholderiaceae bacterium]
MKAVVMQRRHGGPEALRMTDLPTPTPKAGELLVRVQAASVNDWDWGLLQATASRRDRLLGHLATPRVTVLGCDVAGRVEAVGAGVEAWQPGDELHADLSAHGFGAFAEFVCVPATGAARKPPGMSFEQAAAIPQAGMLAVQGLIDAGGLRPGQRLLLNGAGGGVGTFAVQLAKLHGAEVTAVDKRGKLEMLRALGADRVIDFDKQDFTAGKERYDLILDVKTDRSPFAYARVLARGGSYVTVGGATGRLLQVLALGLVVSRLQGKRMRLVMLKPNKDLVQLDRWFEAGSLRPVIDRTYELPELPEAFRRFASGDHHGKIVVKVA